MRSDHDLVRLAVRIIVWMRDHPDDPKHDPVSGIAIDAVSRLNRLLHEQLAEERSRRDLGIHDTTPMAS
jgi:hypothetical protein